MKNRDSPVVYICSPFSGDIERNTRQAKAYSRLAVDRGCVPITPHLYLPDFISEETERDLALACGLRLLDACQEIWICGGTVSAGMEREIQYAAAHGIPARRIKEVDIHVRD